MVDVNPVVDIVIQEDHNKEETYAFLGPFMCGLESSDIERDESHLSKLEDLNTNAEDLEDNWRTTHENDVQAQEITTSLNTSDKQILDLADLDSDDEDMIEEWQAVLARHFQATTTSSHSSVGEDHSFSFNP